MTGIARQNYLLIFLCSVSILALLFGGYEAYQNKNERADARRWDQHSNDVLKLSSVAAQANAEAVMRGRSEISGDKPIESKESARVNTTNKLQDLKDAVIDNQTQINNVDEICRAVKERWKAQDEYLTLIRRTDENVTMPLAQTRISLDSDQRVNAAFLAFNEQERVLQNGRHQIFLNLDEKSNNIDFAVKIGALVAILLLSYFGRGAINRNARAQVRAQRAVDYDITGTQNALAEATAKADRYEKALKEVNGILDN